MGGGGGTEEYKSVKGMCEALFGGFEICDLRTFFGFEIL